MSRDDMLDRLRKADSAVLKAIFEDIDDIEQVQIIADVAKRFVDDYCEEEHNYLQELIDEDNKRRAIDINEINFKVPY